MPPGIGFSLKSDISLFRFERIKIKPTLFQFEMIRDQEYGTLIKVNDAKLTHNFPVS